MNHATMRRRGFSPSGPSRAALESGTIIWAQDLDGTGVTVFQPRVAAAKARMAALAGEPR